MITYPSGIHQRYLYYSNANIVTKRSTSSIVATALKAVPNQVSRVAKNPSESINPSDEVIDASRELLLCDLLYCVITSNKI